MEVGTEPGVTGVEWFVWPPSPSGLVSRVGWIEKAKLVIQYSVVNGDEKAGEYVVNRVASSVAIDSAAYGQTA